MYLKSLTLKGFKSFADRAHMVFEPGLTVVVGPNGSGKSNVSDAILWVLGEQSAKQLRGQAMEDVVFAGSSARKPVGVAEVDLTLDNSDGTLPVDFDEVVITRRMYRSGESEYLVNGSPARLLDITDILHDSGLGKDTHSIISQGKLDTILMSRPEERRALIEEAAGISKHKRRRERAERKLASMDVHLRRALDVQKEVARQLRPLERQVARAQRANELSARALELRVSLEVDDLRRLQARWKELEDTEVAAARELADAEAALAARQDELAALQARLDERGVSSTEAAERRRRCQSAADRLASGERLLDEKGRNMRARLEELRSSLGRSEARARDAAAELDEAAAERAVNRAAARDLRARMDAANARVRAARDARREAEGALNAAQARLRGLQRERDAASVALAKARDAAENARVQDDLLASRVAQLEEAQRTSERDAAQAEERLETLRADLEQARADEAASRQAVDDARAVLARAQADEGAARRERDSAQAQAAGLEQSARAGENAAPLAGRLASKGAAGEGLPRASEVLDVPAELASLVEHLLGGGLAGFVADGAEDLAALATEAATLSASSGGQVELFDRTGFPDAAPAPAQDPSRAGAPGYALLDRVGVRPGYEGVARALLGDVRVVATVEEACAAAQADPACTYATPQGWAVARGGRVRAGEARDGTAGLLERRRMLRELQARLPGLAAGADEAARAAGQAEADLSEARAAHEAHAQLVARLAGEVTSLSSEVQRLRRAAGASASELGRVRDQRSSAARRAQEAAASTERDAEALAAAEEAIGELDGELAEAQDAFDAARREDRAAHDEANACQLELARVQERAGGLESRCARLQREAAELAVTLEEGRALAAALEARCARVGPLAARYAALREAAEERAALARELAGRAEADASGLRRSIEEARVAVADADVARSRALTGAGEVRVAKGRLDVQVENAVKAISSHKGVVLEDALGLPEPADRAADERELQKLEGELAQIGPVNQVAFEEYENLRRRSDYIGEQVDDLQRARGDLAKILSAIDRKMRASFTDTFKKVNENFEEVFAMLFPGGNGHLELTEPDDPATTGIEVVAQPRGKRVTKMSLLSGGERSLTALGLLFAVYRTRTVPFYVLDEVEAALDDSNLDRLLAAIETLRKTTQLIVISHQRRTMESADVLYGVSMQADGVSRVISQKLDREAAPAS